MFAAVIMLVLAVVAVAGLVSAIRNKRVTIDGRSRNTRGIAWLVTGVATALLLFVTWLACVYSQDPGEAKVLKSFTGEVVGTDTTEGLGFTAPWVSLVNYDIRNQVVTYVGDGEGQTGPAIPAQDMDGATATIDIVVRYSIDPASVESIYRQYGEQPNFVSRLVQNDVRAIVRNTPLLYRTNDFRLKRDEAATKMRDDLAKRWEKAGIIVDSVDLRNITYPENIEKSLQDVQTATNKANEAKANLETAKVNADIRRENAQADADYDQIVRCGAKTEEDPVTKKVRLIPLQGVECQNRLNEQVLTNKYIEALQEIAGKPGNTIVVPQGSMPMIQIPAGK